MKKSLPWLFLIFGIIFSTLIWKHISLPYDSSNTIIGQYSKNKINPLNDTIRGLSFIFFPLLLYLIAFIRYNKELINTKIFQSNPSIPNNGINLICFLLIIFSILEFYNLNYKDFLGGLDVHHEGTFLTAQLNFLSKNKVWTGTFFDYGFLGNSIGIFSNFVFDDYSIGIQRFSIKFLILVNKIFILLICRKIILSLNFTSEKELLFLVFSLASLSLASFYENVTAFHPRIFVYLIFTFLVCNLITSNKKSSLQPLLIGFFSLISIIFYWDIGTYINALLLILLIYLFSIRKLNDFFKIISGIIISWLVFYLFLPISEFKEFINQYYIIFNISDYLIGIEYPEPFSEKSTRHTKALLMIIITGALLINFIFDKIKKESIESKFLLIFLFISSIVFFKSGLTRSDGPHIKYTSGIYTLLIFFFISYYLINFLSKFQFYSQLKVFIKKKNILLIFTPIICFLFIFQNSYSNLVNIVNFDKNFYKITKIDDYEFLEKDYYQFLQEYKKITEDENCVQQFTDDNSIPYLVGKPTCTKYFVTAHIIKNWTEEDFINELKISEPNFIVYSSKINWFKSRNNAPGADKFILKNYFLYKDLSPWIIYKKKNI